MTVIIKNLSKADVIGIKASYRENVTVLPAQHGRLIDEHAFLLTENNSNAWTLEEFAHLVVAVKSSPTIIEAERGADD